MADIIYTAALDDKQVLAALQRIDANIDKMASEADKDFDRVGKSAGASGAEIGVMAGIVGSLATEFIRLGEQAVRVLGEILSRSVEVAQGFDTLHARLLGIFQGNREAATEAFDFIQKKSKELGIDLSEVAGAFLPKVQNLDQFERVAKIATALARSDPEQGAIGARIALIEALSGTFTSLQRRFEIPKDDIKALQDAFSTGGMEGFITKFEEVLKKSGKGFDDLSNTAATSFAKIEQAGQQLEGRLGTPIVAELKKLADSLNEFITENEDDIVIFADTIGRSIAQALELLNQIDLSKIDTKSLIQVADDIQQIVSAVELLVKELSSFEELGTLGSALFKTFNPLLTLLGDGGLGKALKSTAQGVAYVKAYLDALEAVIIKTAQALGKVAEAGQKLATGDIKGYIEALQGAQDIWNKQTGLEAWNKSLAESQKNMAAYTQEVEGNKKAQDDLRQKLEDSKNSTNENANALLEAAAAERKAKEEAEKYADAKSKVDEAMAAAELDFQRKLEDIDINVERKRLDIAIEFAQKREDEARKNVDKLADIRLKNEQAQRDARKDLSRTEEDIARKHANDTISLEQEQRDKRVDIERNFRLKLEDIQRQFLLDADEAELRRDAIGFLRALKQRNEKVQQATIDRSREVEDVKITNERKRVELARSQQEELLEARIQNKRKLEDLRISLNREIDAQNEAYQRSLEEISIGENRKNEELARARERDIEDAQRSYARKLEDLQASLAEELKVIAEFEAQKAKIQAEATARLDEARKKANEANAEGPYVATSDQTDRNKPRNVRRRQEGGSVERSVPFLVGENGPEIFKPQQDGKIVPLHNFMMPNLSPNVGGGSYDNSRQTVVNLPLATANQIMDPIIAHQIKNMVYSAMKDLTR